MEIVTMKISKRNDQRNVSECGNVTTNVTITYNM